MKIGVVIGRFQIDQPHAGHRHVLNTAREENDILMILIGVSVFNTKENPLDYQTRKMMLEEYYGQAIICPVMDHASDKHWSENVDSIIRSHFPHERNITLYCSRNGFSDGYYGRHNVSVLDPIEDGISASNRRKEIKNQILWNSHRNHFFREGMIYHSQIEFDRINPTVDIAMVKDDDKVLMMKRNYEGACWRLPGGFVDIKRDPTLELAARREFFEETGLSCETDPKYVCSEMIADYRNTPSSRIITTLFYVPYSHGRPECKDLLEDLKVLEWVPLGIDLTEVDTDHQGLLIKLGEYLEHHN